MRRLGASEAPYTMGDCMFDSVSFKLKEMGMPMSSMDCTKSTNLIFQTNLSITMAMPVRTPTRSLLGTRTFSSPMGPGSGTGAGAGGNDGNSPGNNGGGRIISVATNQAFNSCRWSSAMKVVKSSE